MTNQDETRLEGSQGQTRLSGEPATGSGWLSSSGSIDHGRFAPGTMLDNRYRVIGLLGRGGMGEVYRADDLRLGQTVALKFLPEALATDARRLAQFHNEVRTARQVSHPNVCRVYDIGEITPSGSQPLLFLSMEYVDGEDLSSLLRRIGRLSEERAIELSRQMAAGLAAAHERGILHRDLKPANIMLDGNGRVRIMDFSLAAIGAVDDVRAGTPAYMAPEQLAGREVTVRSDIYALGLVLYELFTGRRAFDVKTIADLVAQHQSGSITAPATIVTSLDPVVDRAIMRCLDPDPMRRPSSALAVAASLPGGDPLAAALAAGETPSPEMVAAAGGQGATLTFAQGLGWLAVFAVMVIACLRIADRDSFLMTIPLEKSADVLADRADEIRKAAGYTEVRDRIGRFTPVTEVNTWVARQLTAEQREKVRADGRPSPLLYWYRTSRSILVPKNPLSAPSTSDPPMTSSGMTLTVVDTAGRLVRFEAVPPQQETPVTGATANWDALFVAAALDRASFTETAPTRTPPAFADERRAWTGVLPGSGLDVRIEAATYRGRPVSFEVLGAWSTPTRDHVTDATPASSPVVIAILLVGAVLAARANLRTGRADRRGATRLALVEIAVMVLAWATAPHVADAGSEQQRLFSVVGISLFLGGVVYLIYLGLEPFLRRSSPLLLVGWSRALAGRWRDPLVGRDVLIGITVGAVASCLSLLPFALPRWFHWTAPEPYVVNIGALSGVRLFLTDVFQGVNTGLQSGLITVFTWVTARVVAEWIWNRTARRLRPSWPALSGTAFAVVVSVVFAISAAGSGIAGHPAANLALGFASMFVMLLMVTRAGLLAMAVMALTENFLSNFALTTDANRLYGPASYALVITLAAVALLGFWLARGGDATPRRASAFGGQ